MKLSELQDRARKSPIFNGFLITTVGSGLSKVILVVSTFYCTNMLTKAEFGGFSFIRNTLNMILVICALNYVGLCVKFTAEARYQERASKRLLLLFGFSLALCFIAGLFLLLLPDSMMLSILGDASLIGYFRVLGLMLPALMLQPLLEGVFRGLKEFKLIGYLQVGSSVFFFAFIALGIQIAGYDGAVYGMILYYLLYALISLIYAFRFTNVKVFVKNNIQGLRNELPVLWNMILPVFLLSFIEAPINWWAQTLMTKHDSLASIASMTAIVQIRNLTILLPNYFGSAFVAFAASMNAEHNYKEYFGKNDKVIVLLTIISMAFFMFYELFDNQILSLYGESYEKDTFPFLISNIVIPFMIIGNFLKGNLTIMEHQRFMLLLSVFHSLIFITIIYVMIHLKYDSVVSYFCGQIGQYVFTFIACYYVYLKDKKLKLNKKL
jgi:O-antigen/teichoic acid export membrane protein